MKSGFIADDEKETAVEYPGLSLTKTNNNKFKIEDLKKDKGYMFHWLQ